MPRLTLAEILQKRQQRLQAANTPVSSTIAVTHGLPSTSLNALTTPPKKKVFSIFSWNIRDYKGSKIVAEKKGKEDNPFINQFVKVVAEALKIDLLMIIETDVDLTEAVARIEDEPSNLFGYHATNPSAVISPLLPDDPRDSSTAQDAQYWAKVKQRVEALSGGDTNYIACGSEMAYRKVNLPPSFTLAQLQGDIYKQHPHGPVSDDGLPWWHYLEAVCKCYDVYFNNSQINHATLINSIQKLSGSGLTKNYVFKLKTKCGTCGGLKRLPSTENCHLCHGSGDPIDLACPDCRGSKHVIGNAQCTMCNGGKAFTQPCGCGGQCRTCGGTAHTSCPICGGPKHVVCPQCNGQAWSASGPCSYCGGHGSGLSQPSCFACGSQGFISCGSCGGSGKCKHCGGSGNVLIACPGCGGAGVLKFDVPCQTCNESGINPEHACSYCKGLGGSYCTMCTGASCAACGGSNWVKCAPCGGDGTNAEALCVRCHGTGLEDICRVCAGTGIFDPDAEENALQILLDILSPKEFTSVDVETYTLLWRKPDKVLPPTVFGSYYAAVDNKAVWLNVGRMGLHSKNSTGQELGFQDPKKLFNSRMPYVIPLVMDINSKKRLSVPVVLFHAIWGEKTGMKAAEKNPLVKQRADSIQALSLLGVTAATGDVIPVNKADGSILVGDFNLDYNAGQKSRDKYASDVKQYALKVYQALESDGYLAAVGGTQTGLTTKPVGIQRLQKGGGQDIHTFGYDNFMIKGGDIQANIIDCGVFDILKFIEDMLASDTQLQAWLDNDYLNSVAASAAKKSKKPKAAKGNAKQKAPVTPTAFKDNRVRAFYLYHEYISDHLPIILDILVDEVDPQYAKSLEEKAQQIQVKIDTPIPAYYGTWNSVSSSTAQPSAAFDQNKIKLCGVVSAVCFPNLIEISIEGGARFFGPCTAVPASALLPLLGQNAQGEMALGPGTSIEKSNYFGFWLSNIVPASEETWLVKPTSETQCHVRGRFKWADKTGKICISSRIKSNETGEILKRTFEGRGNLPKVAVGDWVEAMFELTG